jgi:hypothetical protein
MGNCVLKLVNEIILYNNECRHFNLTVILSALVVNRLPLRAALTVETRPQALLLIV